MSVETIMWGVIAAVIWLGIYQIITVLNGTPFF